MYDDAVRLYATYLGGVDPEALFFGPVLVWLGFVAAYAAVGLTFTLVDLTRRPRWVYRRKIQLDSPFLAGGGPKNPSLAATLTLLMLSFAVALATLLAMQFVTVRWLGRGLRVSPVPASWLEFALHVVVWVLGAEVGFYLSHRLMHVPFLYQHIHKTHHRFKTPIAISAFYAHPVEVVVANMGAHFVWPFIFGMHPGVVTVAVMLGISQSMVDHSGYWLSPSRKAFQPFL